VRFKDGKTETLTTLNPKSSAQQIQTPSEVVELVNNAFGAGRPAAKDERPV
jgi:hypothetical protein